jgi:predicted PurR-regulated permease PerM
MSKQHLSSDISTNTFIRFWLVMLGFVATAFIIYLIRDALLLIGISAFLAIALNPPVNAIASKLPSRSRVLATAIAYLMVVLLLTGFILTVVPTVSDQMAKFFRTVPSIVQNISDQSHWLTDIVDQYGLQKQYDQSIDSIQSQASEAATQFGSSIFSNVGSIITMFVTTLLILVMTFLMLIEGPLWRDRLWATYRNKAKRKHHQQLVHKMYRVITGYVNGQVLIAGISAVCSLVAVVILSTIFDMPPSLAIPIAVIVFTMGLIPMFGATIGAIIAGILIAINSITAAIIFLVYYFIYQQIENNFISPTIQSRAVEISALTVLISLTIGLSLFGILGGLISIPIGGCLRVLLLDHIEQRREQAQDEKA